MGVIIWIKSLDIDSGWNHVIAPCGIIIIQAVLLFNLVICACDDLLSLLDDPLFNINPEIYVITPVDILGTHAVGNQFVFFVAAHGMAGENKGGPEN